MELDVGVDVNIQNIVCLCKIVSVCNKQHLSNIWCSVREKVKQHWDWVEKMCCL